MQDILRKIKENIFFEIFVVSLIVTSGILIGVKTFDNIPQNIINGIAAIDYGITLFFLFEIFIRILAERRRIDFFKSGWNVFDFTIIVISAIPASLFESVLILRLLRLIRVLRLITFVPQFKVIINSIFLSIPRVFYVLLFMFINFYIFAVAGVTFFAEVNEYNWGNIGLAMLTLFQIATLEAWPDLLNEAMAYNSFSWVFFGLRHYHRLPLKTQWRSLSAWLSSSHCQNKKPLLLFVLVQKVLSYLILLYQCRPTHCQSHTFWTGSD